MYQILIDKKAEKNLYKLPESIRTRIIRKIKLLAKNPYEQNNNIKKLKGRDGYRLRIGNYRVIYKINDENITILIVDIGHRKEIYH